MRTGTKKCMLLLLSIIVLCFAVWLLWPHSFAEVTGIPERPEINLSGVVAAARVENGQPSFDTWELQNCLAGSAEYEAVLSVLQEGSYRQDPRNLLPGERISVGNGKGYDSRSVLLIFVWGPAAEDCCSLAFSGTQVVISGPNSRGFRIYHPADVGLLDRLIGELQRCGVKS